MNESAGNDLATLYKKMEKYNFNKEFNVTVSIIESDDNIEHSEPHNDSGNKEGIIRSERMDIETRQERFASDEITSVFFENAHISNKVNENNNNEKSNSSIAFMLPKFNNKSAEIQDNSQTNVNSSETDILRPQDQILNSRPPTVYGNKSSSCTEINAQLNENHNYLDMLSMHMINILKTYRYFKSYLNNCGYTELSQKNCNEKYTHVKERYFRVCCDIVKRIILPLGNNFNVRDFLNKTIHIANPSDKNTCTYGDLQTIYNEILASCYKQLSSQQMHDCFNNTNTNVINTGHNLISQENLYNCGRRIEPEIIHNGYHPILQQNSQNNWHSSNMLPTSNNRPGNGHHNNITPTINKENNLIFLQNSQNNWHSGNITQTMNKVSDYGQYNNVKSINNNGHSINMTETMNWHSNNLTQTVNNGSNPAFQENLRNDGHYNVAQTIYKVPNSTLQQNSKERLMSNVVNPTSNASNAILQELLRNHSYYYEQTQTISKKPISVTDPNYKNNSQLKNVIQKGNKNTNSLFNHDLENNQNYNNESRNSSEVPTTCVFQYKNPNYEVRLDVNTQLLSDVSNTNQANNNYSPADDPNYVRKQYSSSDVRKSGQATESLNTLNQDVSQILQEPTRSTSRDSGFMSPCNNQMNDACSSGEGQEPTTPYITNVTSLNPKAIQIPVGACFVCGELTKKKCLGCFKCYYCSHKCQKLHWSSHRLECTDVT